MASTYIAERQSETWSNEQIREFFTKIGFKIITLPVEQHIEHLIPADFIFFDKKRAKLFGLQYKALYHNGKDYWNISKQQLEDLKPYPWIYYCLSELKNAIDHEEALHFARITTRGALERHAPKLNRDATFRAYLR